MEDLLERLKNTNILAYYKYIIYMHCNMPSLRMDSWNNQILF